MTWTVYAVRLRLHAPLHIGRSKIGNLQHTYPYVHGRALWGALTARLTRDSQDSPSAQTYQKMGERVHQELAFGYFYPCTLDAAGQEQSWFPWQSNQASRFLSSYTSTALNYAQNAAQEASLHEIEYLAPHTLDRSQAVYLTGRIAAADDCNLAWQAALKRIRLGGELTYGFGRVSLDALLPAPDWFGYPVDPKTAGRLALQIPMDGRFYAHCAAALPARGRAGPFAGRMWRNQPAAKRLLGAGQLVAYQGVYWEPGSQASQDLTIQIGNYGLWEAANPG